MPIERDTPLPTVADLAKDFTDSQAAAAKWYADHQNAEGKLDVDAEGVKTFRDMQSELKTKREAWEAARDADDQAKSDADLAAQIKAPQERIVKGGDPSPTIGAAKEPDKSLGERFVESKAYKDFLTAGKPQHNVSVMDVDLDKHFGKGRGFKTLFDTANSFAVQSVRLPEPITPGAQQPTIASLMPEGRTSQPVIAYMEETTTTSNAAEVTEGDPKPEAALAFTEKTSAVRKLAVSLPVTDESLEDIPFIESYIDTRLRFFIQEREDSQLINGNGTPPNLRGLLNVSGILTQARGTDPNQDAIFKAATQIQTNAYFDADAVVMNPANWQTIRLMTTADGIYLFGSPSQAGPDTLWGYRVVKTTAIASGTGLVGAFRLGAEVFRRSNLALSVGWVADQFIENKRTILVEERLALVAFRPKAFCKVTSLS